MCAFCFSICLTKLDILDDFEEVKIGVAYLLDGEKIESMPGKNRILRFYEL